MDLEPFALCKPRTRPREVVSGDPAFDERFRVETVAGGQREIRYALRSALRAQMLALSTRFDVRMQHGTLILRTDLGRVAPNHLRAWVDDAANGVRALGATARGYR